MFWFIALFDEKTEQMIKEIWNDLSKNAISFYAEEVKDGRPHLTLGSYYDLNKKEFIQKADQFYNNTTRVDITFNTIGSFLNYQTLFLSPTVTTELLDFHSSHHDYFKEFSNNANSLYFPGKWIPHCTLANRLSAEKLSEAFSYCLKRNDTIYGKIREVALVELVGKDNNTVDARIIYSKPLV